MEGENIEKLGLGVCDGNTASLELALSYMLKSMDLGHLANMIQDLEVDERNILALVYYEGLSLKETSLVLDLAESDVTLRYEKIILGLCGKMCQQLTSQNG